MIDVYAILDGDNTIELYITKQEQKSKMQWLLNEAQKRTKEAPSKKIKNIQILTHNIYYFKQEPFTFILCTKVKERNARVQNYLLIVADIFYENYDEKKFPFILTKTMEEINRIQFGEHYNNKATEEEETLLGRNSIIDDKKRLNFLVHQRNSQSQRAFMLSTILFVLIMVLGVFYLRRRWE